VPARLSVAKQSQTATKHKVLCCGFVGLLVVAIVLFGLLTNDEAVLALQKHQLGLSRLDKGGLPGRLDPFGPVDPRAAGWLAAALARPVNAGPQASALPVPDAGQGGLVTLRGNTRPEAKAINDRGRVSDDLIVHHMMLQLQRTPEQERALQQFINDIHDPNSPLFHHWITAAEFGQRYGVASGGIAAVTSWLESQGFEVNLVYPNQMVIDFSGSAGQIRQAFRTEIHHLLVNGQAHIANMSDPQIPAELTSTVAGIVSLNDFRPHPMLKRRAKDTVGNGYYLVVPADLATIYNFNPAFASDYSGQGQTIVLIEDTDLYTTADWDTFRSVLGLASAYPLGSLAQVHPPSSPTNNCTDPGVNGDDVEAALDVEWASAGAPSAAIELASCADTDTNFGGFIALENLLNASGTPPAIVSISYGESESYLGASFNAYISSLYQQAVAEGVSVFVSSGDEGAASSDADEAYAVNGITVSGFTSTPYDVSVGGTDFADAYQGAQATYWNSANTATYGSALSYVPEIPWNDSCASVLIGDYVGILPTYSSDGLCNNASYSNLITTVAGSGGPSGCATGAPDASGVVSGACAGYPKPAWQSGLIGNPSDGVRDIPDVSLFAANGIWGHYYAFCYSDPAWGYDCTGPPDTWAGAGGTSFAAPIMAAIQSLINEASGTRWGNPNPSYYSLAATEYGSSGSSSCKSALGNAVAPNCIFYDVTQIPLLHTGSGTGGDIDVPCFGVNCYAPSGTYGVLSTAPQTLSSALVTSLGSGYKSAPSCTLSGGGGSGAACSASLTGVVSTLSLTNGGSGYTTYPISCTLTGGGGTGASCEAFICTNNEVCYVGLTSFGSGYTSAPTCTISGGGGTGATCTATEAPGITASLTAAGSGYTTLPHCVLTGGGGTGGTCAAMAVNTSDGYQPAFGAATGWDFATGIGTVNVANLVGSFASSAVTLSPPSLAFSLQPLYTSSAAQSVTVTNTGTAKLSILTVKIAGTDASDFAKSADTCTGATVIPNGTCAVGVKFTPSAAGSLSASLSFTDIAPNSPQTMTLSGTGTGVGVGFSPTSITFPDQALGSSSSAQTVTLTNTGNLPLALTSIAITGSNSGDFAQTNTCGSTVGAGANCAIKVTFTPVALGSRTGAITITDNALDSPQTVSLTGTGVNPVPFVNQPLTPTSVAPGGSGFTLTVNGTDFAPGATVDWNGVALATTSVSGEKLTATVPAANIASPGMAWVTVVNPGPALISNVIFFSVTTSTPAVTFSNASGSPIAAGAYPVSIAVGDFNGDGKLDLAVANQAGKNLTILLGNGDGTFTPAASSPSTGDGPFSIAVGDFNGDGKLDLAVANLSDNTVTILLGNGDGTFTPAAASPSTGTAPMAVAVGDFNGDGKLDLAVANSGSNNVTILLGNGDGTFTPAAASPGTGNGPSGLAVGDFNGDGKLDLAVTNQNSNNVTILLGNGDGTFTPAASSPSTGYGPLSIAVGDFNGDGKLDLAVANVTNNDVTVLLGNGDGTFTPTASSPATASLPTSIAVGDFNGEGKLDLAVANFGSNNVTILMGNGDGTFTPGASSPTTGSSPYSIATGDFNRDGRLDLATSNYSSNNVSVLLQLLPGPVAGVSPASLTFGNQNVGTTSTSQPVTLSNTSSAALTITGIAASANFGQTNNCGSSLAASGSCTINVTLSPTATGQLSGTLTITDNSNGVAGSTQTVSLTGTGVNPVPTLSALSPSSATAGGAAFTLTVTGTNFVSTSTVEWNGTGLTTTYGSATKLTASVPASDIATAGTASVTVVNPTPGGGTSSGLTFTINNPSPTPTSLSPSSATAGGAAFTLTVAGTNFVSTSTVKWKGTGLATKYVSATELTATVPASDIATAGTASVTVVNPTPGGGTSSGLTFTINNPKPKATSLSPSSVTAGGAAFTLTVTGTHFVSTSTVKWNGTGLTTTYVSATKLTASVPASDIATAGTPSVTVVNPTPGGGASSGLTFTINNPKPKATSLSPSSATAGGAAFTLTVKGTNFVSTSTVQWKGTGLTTTYVSATKLTAAVPASDIATAGTASVKVVNPSPGGGTSSGLTFTIR
jgi:hypothetical protein